MIEDIKYYSNGLSLSYHLNGKIYTCKEFDQEGKMVYSCSFKNGIRKGLNFSKFSIDETFIDFYF